MLIRFAAKLIKLEQIEMGLRPLFYFILIQ